MLVLKVIDLLAIIVFAVWWGDDGGWEPFAGLLLTLGAFLGFEARTTRRRHHHPDTELFLAFLKEFPSESIGFYARGDFTAPFSGRHVAPIRDFVETWADASHRFVDDGLEVRRLELHKRCANFLDLMAANTVSIDSSNFHRVPEDWKGGPHDRYGKATSEMKVLSRDLFKSHQDLVTHGRQRLHIPSPDYS